MINPGAGGMTGFLGATEAQPSAQPQFSLEPFMQLHSMIQALAQQYPAASQEFVAILQALQSAVIKIRGEGSTEPAAPRVAG